MINTMVLRHWNFSKLLRRSLSASFGLAVFAATIMEMHAGPLDSVDQLVVAIAPKWDSSSGQMQRFERSGADWKTVGSAFPVLFGKNGLVWGRGVLGTDEPGPHKTEKDKRAPAGVFRIGKIYTYDAQLPKGSAYPYHTVTKADAWIDDPTHPQYNQHVAIEDPANPPAWFDKQKMRHGDFAYRWLVEIRHNSDPPIVGGGSAIFFHIRRGPQRPSAGCTTMAEENLVTLIRWLRADKNPHYVLLPREEYVAKWKLWGLPSPELTATAGVGG
jgi:L,D-peptidoglycan transpeptidase YkuD (ErfK/YbiS/YcfS/YnhG family)